MKGKPYISAIKIEKKGVFTLGFQKYG